MKNGISQLYNALLAKFYVSAATAGKDPVVRASPPELAWGHPHHCAAGQHKPCSSLNYACLLAYSYLTRLTPIATSTLAAVLVMLLSTLGTMLALADLPPDGWARRAAQSPV